jgi:hypothetical protein
MVLITPIVFAEKSLAWERTAIYATAALLILYGAAVIARPQALPTFAPNAPAMNMPGMTMPAAPAIPAK